MNIDMEEIRKQMLNLLETTRGKTQSLLSGIDPKRVVHTDQAGWRVRDILGHVGVWNGEAARSVQAHAEGSEYHCISSEAQYDEYNDQAAAERSSWKMEQVWAEYEASNDQLKSAIDAMPVESWTRDMLYPWNEKGSVQRLIEMMMQHEVEHRDIILVTQLDV